jgi:hypothetical protein
VVGVVLKFFSSVCSLSIVSKSAGIELESANGTMRNIVKVSRFCCSGPYYVEKLILLWVLVTFWDCVDSRSSWIGVEGTMLFLAGCMLAFQEYSSKFWNGFMTFVLFRCCFLLDGITGLLGSRYTFSVVCLIMIFCARLGFCGMLLYLGYRCCH